MLLKIFKFIVKNRVEGLSFKKQIHVALQDVFKVKHKAYINILIYFYNSKIIKKIIVKITVLLN